MTVLGIETATPSGGVAVLDDSRLLAVQAIHGARAHSRLIMPAVEAILRELELDVTQLDAVAVSRGPGSFTGVRVGLTIAKALCESGSPRMVLISTLEALARRCWGGESVEFVMPLLNARRGEVYGALFAIKSGGLGSRVGDEFALAPGDVLERWPGRTLVAGEGAIEYASVWSKAPADGVVFARPDRNLCGPEQVALLGLEAARRGDFADPATSSPVYLREASVSTPKRGPRR